MEVTGEPGPEIWRRTGVQPSQAAGGVLPTLVGVSLGQPGSHYKWRQSHPRARVSGEKRAQVLGTPWRRPRARDGSMCKSIVQGLRRDLKKAECTSTVAVALQSKPLQAFVNPGNKHS